MKKYFLPITLASLLFTSQACFRNIKDPSCRTWEMENKKLEACILYDKSGKPASSRYTIYNGWNLPIITTYDNGVDGPDGNVEYKYNNHHKLKIKKGNFKGNKNRLEERLYDIYGNLVLILVDENGDGVSDDILYVKK